MSIGNSNALTLIKQRNALMNNLLYLYCFNKLAGMERIITVTLQNVAVQAHSTLNVGAVGTLVMSTKLVMSLSITNNVRQLEMKMHVAMTLYKHLMSQHILVNGKKILNYTLDTGMIIMRVNMLASF